ncbi:MAG: hypothetical protein AAGK21_03920 [Bacteroidota bacterium]
MPRNKIRSLGQIAVANAWFDLVERDGPPRYSFHLDVSFRRERIGGEEGDPARFRVALKECEVVVLLPTGETELRIDRRTIATHRSSRSVERTREQVSSQALQGTAGMEVGPEVFGARANAAAGLERATKETTTSRSEGPPLLGQRSATREGDLSWVISRNDGSDFLDDVLWDAKMEPRFEIVDGRDERVQERDARTQIYPTFTVEVRCRSEDLRIDEIELTDPDERGLLSRLGAPKKRQKAAEALIKRELQMNGLRVGDIHQPYSRLVVGDLIVALVEDATAE